MAAAVVGIDVSSFEDLILEEASGKKPQKTWVKKFGVVVAIMPDGSVQVATTHPQRTEVAVIHVGVGKPVALKPLTWNAARYGTMHSIPVEAYTEKPRRKDFRKTKRKYVELTMWQVTKLGIKAELKTYNSRGVSHNTLTFPDNVLPSHRKYTEAQQLQMNELLLMGAVWCSFKDRHFLAVLP